MPPCSSLCLQHPAQGLVHTQSSGKECVPEATGPHWTVMLLLRHTLGKPLQSLRSPGEEIPSPSRFYIWILSCTFLPCLLQDTLALFHHPESGCKVAAKGASLSIFPSLTPTASSGSWMIGEAEVIGISWVQWITESFSAQSYQIPLDDPYSWRTRTGVLSISCFT